MLEKNDFVEIEYTGKVKGSEVVFDTTERLSWGILFWEKEVKEFINKNTSAHPQFFMHICLSD